MNRISSLLIYDNNLSVVVIDELDFFRKVPIHCRRGDLPLSLRSNMDITRYMYSMFSLLISLKYVARSPTDNKPDLVPLMLWLGAEQATSH